MRIPVLLYVFEVNWPLSAIYVSLSNPIGFREVQGWWDTKKSKYVLESVLKKIRFTFSDGPSSIDLYLKYYKGSHSE